MNYFTAAFPVMGPGHFSTLRTKDGQKWGRVEGWMITSNSFRGSHANSGQTTTTMYYNTLWESWAGLYKESDTQKWALKAEQLTGARREGRICSVTVGEIRLGSRVSATLPGASCGFPHTANYCRPQPETSRKLQPEEWHDLICL